MEKENYFDLKFWKQTSAVVEPQLSTECSNDTRLDGKPERAVVVFLELDPSCRVMNV